MRMVFWNLRFVGNGSIEFSEMKKAIQAMYDNTSVNVWIWPHN